MAEIALYRTWGREISTLAGLRELPDSGILARCLFGEARGVPRDEKAAVGCVIANRVKWWRKTYADIILQPYQFSWTMNSDPNQKKVLDPLKCEPPHVWDMCCEVAECLVVGVQGDVTMGADHYYDKSMDANPPSWAATLRPTIQTNHFRFFRSERVKVV